MSERRERQDGDEAEHSAARASRLEIGPDELRELSAQTFVMVSDYFTGLSELPVFPNTTAAELSERFNRALPVEAASLEQIMDDCRAIIHASRHNGHPRFFGYVAS